MSSGHYLCLRVPAELGYRDVVMRTCASACNLVTARRWGTNGDRIDVRSPFTRAVVSALSEVFNNVVMHGFATREPTHVLITIETTQDSITVSSLDYGARFELGATTSPRVDRLPERGMGLFIAQSFLDELAYRPGPPNQWILRKHLAPEERCDFP